MNRIGKAAVAMLAATGVAMAMPASAADNSHSEKLRQLDIMLMVTSLRCRTTPDNFQPEFQRFEAAHMDTLNQATREMREGLVARHGVTGATRALDRMSTVMANQYGRGHPWLGCAELKVTTRILANMRGRAALVEAADQLLAPSSSGSLAYARR
jgi:hypothetical protein